MHTFSHTHTVGFSEVDRAGIVFFSRFFEMAHEGLEAFFQELGWGFAGIFREGRWGFPLVHAEADYHAPAHLGDGLGIEIAIARLSETAFTVHYVIGAADGKSIATVQTSHVWVDTGTFKKIPLPDDLRAKLAGYQKEHA